MSRIVLSTIGSLGDLHPMIAIGLELRRRGHAIVINTWSGYEEKITGLGFEFRRLRPDIDPDDREIHRKAMDAAGGAEFVIRDIMLANIRDTFEDLKAACEDADAMVTGELLYAADSVSRLDGVKWISTSLQPISLFSAEDPNIYLQSRGFELMRAFPSIFHRAMIGVMRLVMSSWLEEYRTFRRELGLDADHDPVVRDKFSPLKHLVLFSEALARPQSDWPRQAVQTGFCFYDESETSDLDPRLEAFLSAGEAPIVFTLGSAAIMDAGDFFDESAKAAKALGRRAVLLYGRDCPVPQGLSDDIAAFEYAPYSLVFSRAACVVHQGGVGTTAQVLRAGVPAVIMPFSHDQPDNAARCKRAGVAEIIPRGTYSAARSAEMIETVLSDPAYAESALKLKQVIESENGTQRACDEIEQVLRAEGVE